jgi:hypothetical protein
MSTAFRAVGVGAVIVAVALVAAAAVAQPRESNTQRPPVPPEPPQPPAVQPEKHAPEPASVRLQVTVFKVEVEKSKLIELDAKRLAADGATPAKLAQVLQGFGAADAMYRIDQVVAGGGKKASISCSTPYTSGTGTSKEGQQTVQVARADTGVQIGFSATYAENDRQHLRINLELDLSTMTKSVVEVGKDSAAPIFWKVQQSFGDMVAIGQSIVLLSADGGARADVGTPIAFVTLVTLSDPGW